MHLYFNTLNNNLENMNNLFIRGTSFITVPASNTQCNVATTTIELPRTLSDSNYIVLLTLRAINTFTQYDKNYDVEVFASDKTTNSFKISLHRGTEGFLSAGGTWYVDYLVII